MSKLNWQNLLFWCLLCKEAFSKLFDPFYSAFEILEFQNLYCYGKVLIFLEKKIFHLKTV